MFLVFLIILQIYLFVYFYFAMIWLDLRRFFWQKIDADDRKKWKEKNNPPL